jgi:hypothetical protein
MLRCVLALMLTLWFAPAFGDAPGGALTASAPTAEQPVAAAGAPAAGAKASGCEGVPANAREGAPSTTVIQLDPDTLWRPEGSEVRFSIANTNGGLPAVTQVVVCFRWEGGDPASNQQHYLPSTLVRSIPNTNGQVGYGAVIPNLGALHFYGIGPEHLHVEHTALGTVPLAEMAVMVQMAGSTAPVAVILPVGVTNARVAGAIVLVCVFLACFILWRLVPEAMLSGSPHWGTKISEHVLAVISNPDGVASLSQFQVMLWTFVVAAAAVFVMVLSGNLISISSQMLTLLGIAGGTQILASVNRDKPPAGTAYPTPGKPAWSQMLVDKFSGDIDVTRVQMLMFTLITAAFVAVQVVATYSIPDISDSFMVLMGISNGVYLAGRQIAAPPKAGPPATPTGAAN